MTEDTGAVTSATAEDPSPASGFAARFGELAAIGRDPAGGGWTRLAWTPQDARARHWFVTEAEQLGLDVEQDRNGNLWAWWSPAGVSSPGVATGSHLDTVPGGGAYDGALGVVAALSALELLRRDGVTPVRPIAVVAFADEEGARFGVPTFGSRLAAGVLDPASVLGRRDDEGVRLGDALTAAGVDAAGLGPDERLGTLDAFVELHVEQGRGLVHTGAAVGIGAVIWPHGRWRLTVTGEGNHAGTTRMEDRRDPMAVLAAGIAAAAQHATAAGAVATLGRVLVEPNGTNAVPARVRAWLDARAADDDTLDALVAGWHRDVVRAAQAARVEVELVRESFTAAVRFDPDLSARVAAALPGAPPPPLATAAGHDAGALAAALPTTMLFVRNPSGISHSPAEHADQADCLAGVAALRTVLEDLACR
jgi:N-carbamoyl-L-amino-acid hydrolase